MSAQEQAAPDAPEVTIAPARIQSSTFVALPGLPIRIPLSRSPGTSFGNWVPEPIEVRLVDPNDPAVAEELVSDIIGFTDSESDDATRSASWLSPPTNWQAVSQEDVASGRITTPVYWSLFVRLPSSYDDPEARVAPDERDRAVVLDINGERFPARLARQPNPLPTGRIPVLEASATRWRALGGMLRAEAMDPARRWRASLLTDRFSAGRLFGTESLNDFAPLEDPILAGLARTIEFEVRAALSELAGTDPELAAELLGYLTAISRDLDGGLLPVWPTDGEAETVLFPALLSRALTAEERASRVRQYLRSRPLARSVVVDDAGQSLSSRSIERFRDGGGAAEQVLTVEGATAVTTNLSGRARTLTFGATGEFDADLLQLPAHGTAIVRFDPVVIRSVADDGQRVDENAVAGAIELRDGERRSLLQSQVAPIEVRPPGLQIGPARLPWTLASWNAETIVTAPLNQQTSGLIYHDDRTSTWHLLLDVRAHEDIAHWIDVHFGPFGGGGATVRVDPTSEGVVRSEGRWSTIVELPASAVRRAEQIGWLEIGFVRWHRVSPDADPAVHSSWPRPWFPGQSEPGRFRLNLQAWVGD